MIRFTRQRQAVLEAVRRSSQHPDASRVYAEVRQVIPSISLGTVYRSLETLVREGRLVTVGRVGEATRYDARTEHHHHFLCDGCGGVFDLGLELPDLAALAANGSPGFLVREAVVHFHGTCPGCRLPD